MPKVVVYVPAAKWRELGMAGLDPAEHVRKLVREGLGERKPLVLSLPTRPPKSVEVKPDFKTPIR